MQSLRVKGYSYFLLVLFLSVGCFQLTIGEEFYITPSPSSLCPEQSCLTLSQILANTSNIFNSNTTLFFLLGTHSLHSDLVIGNIPKLKLLTLSQSYMESAKISCGQKAKILINQVHLVYFGHLNFIGCSENKIESAHQFILNGSTFNGQHNTTGTALELSHTDATIINSSFTFNRYGSYRGPIELLCLSRLQQDTLRLQNSTYARVGGALIIKSSNVSVTGSYFEGNSAEIGGAIFIEGTCNIKLTNSSFINNHVIFSFTMRMCFGGAIFYCSCDPTASTFDRPLKGNAITVDNSNFINNTAVYAGGAIAIVSANVYLLKSKITTNSALRGGALMTCESTLTVNESHFEFNSATNEDKRENAELDALGGVIFARNSSSITISKCVFGNNSAYSNGGAIATDAVCNLTILHSKFDKNWANEGGGVIAIEHLNKVFIADSKFEKNTALYGGVVYVHGRSVLNVVKTRFEENESQVGGALTLNINTTAYVNDSLFYNNFAKGSGGAFGAFESHITLNNCSFFENKANETGGVGMAQSSVVVMTESLVVNSTALLGGAINAYEYSSVRIEGSWFEGCKAHGGGVLLLEEKCQLFVRNCEFQYYNQALQGGVMYLNNSCYASINASIFKFNGAAKGGVVFMRLHTQAQINNCEFSHNVALENGGVS